MRSGRTLVCGIVLSLLLLLPGCWNSKDIQNLAYVTAIGLDYEKDKFVIYVQVLNFKNVARTETVEIGKPVPVWIGRGEGRTVTEAFTSLYRTSQLRMFWGHVKVIVAGERVLERGLQEAYDMLNRYREVRYNILLYGTKEKLTDILAEKSLFNLSPLDTLMFNPRQIFSQRSFLPPIYAYKIIARLRESSHSVPLPSIALQNTVWSEDHKKEPMYVIDGAFYFHGFRTTGWMSEREMQGGKWLMKKLVRAPINIPNDKHPEAGLILEKPKSKITPVFENGKIRYRVRVRLSGFVEELHRNLSEDEIEAQAARVVRDEVRAAFLNGLKVKADVLQLEQTLYRRYPQQWKQHVEDKEFSLTEDSLAEVDVKVNIKHAGKYKGRVL